jgi:hypothetical protein
VRESGAILCGCCGGRRGARERCALRRRRDRDGPSSRPRVLACRLASSRALLRRGPSVLSRMSSPSPSRSLRWLMVYPEKIGAAQHQSDDPWPGGPRSTSTARASPRRSRERGPAVEETGRRHQRPRTRPFWLLSRGIRGREGHCQVDGGWGARPLRGWRSVGRWMPARRCCIRGHQVAARR